MKPLVTLAIATFNRTAYLHKSISAVLAQDYENLDILISDNGSCDTTPQLARTLVNFDPRVRFRRNDLPVPIHVHFTQCVRSARGEFFVLLHDDDYINSGFVSELMKVATRHAGVNVVVPTNVTVDLQGTVIADLGAPDREIFDGPTFVCDWLAGRNFIALADVTTVLFRTQTILQFDGYQSLGGSGRDSDNLLFLQCALTSRVGFAPGAVFYWRRHAASCGSRATLRQIADAGRLFIQHLGQDPQTVRTLAALPSSYRKEVLRRIGELTTFELLWQMESEGRTPTLRTIMPLLLRRRDVIFVYVLMREYLRRTSPALYYRLRGIGRLLLPRDMTGVRA